MDKINILSPQDKLFQQRLKSLADPPKKLYYCGTLPSDDTVMVTVVGTRKPTTYGQEVTHRFAYELARQGIVIVSGLALGIDGIAHRAALEAGGTTIAVLAGGLDRIYPFRHTGLAKQIVENNGALISEYPTGTPSLPHQFIARNRIAAALGDGVLITEAASKSGTLHTANFALEAGKEVMAVPGAITNPMASGTNGLICTGATIVTSVEEVLFALGIADNTPRQMPLITNTPEEGTILQLLIDGVQDGEELLQQSQLPAPIFSQTLTMLEIDGRIRPLGANKWMAR